MDSDEKNKLKNRVLHVKDLLPSSILPWYITMYPEHDNDNDKTRVSNVIQLRSVDEDITIKLEDLATVMRQTP